MFTFSVEVNDGLLSTSLPVHLIKTTELKIKNSNQWQPLQTFVTIANQFIPKGRGIRFQGTIEDCNNAMQRLFFLGVNLDSLLTITVNDMGNYGCYSDCTDIMSAPLSTEANVILIKKRPLNSTTAFLLGSAIFFEIAMLFLLGALLLFFICKCMTTLHSEGKNSDDTTNNRTEQLFNDQNAKRGALPFQNAMNFIGSPTIDCRPTGHSLSTPISPSRTDSIFRQRSCSRVKSERSRGFKFPPSYESLGGKPNPSYIEMQKQRQSD
ncbi:Protein GAMETE EXPRESSED 2 [Platanthera guangdongensis]|uniref:Protein GAMETE EXPRESSED 2 n=1 Tax=Platanthera guangdongensis TaxID=2320717 RepID=A0ABR2MMA1_9ASPA